MLPMLESVNGSYTFIKFFSFVIKYAPFLENIMFEQKSFVFMATISSNSIDTIANILIYNPKLIAIKKPQGCISISKGLVLKLTSNNKPFYLSFIFHSFKDPSLSKEVIILFNLGVEIDTIVFEWQ